MKLNGVEYDEFIGGDEFPLECKRNQVFLQQQIEDALLFGNSSVRFETQFMAGISITASPGVVSLEPIP